MGGGDRRRPATYGIAVAVGLAGFVLAPFYGGLALVSAAVAMAAAILVIWRGVVWGPGAAALVSVLVSALYARAGTPPPPDAPGYVEMIALMAGVGGLARRATVRQAIGLGTAVAAAIVVLILRLIAASLTVSPVTAVIACAIFSVGTLAAAAAGAYLRALDARRRRAVAEARQAQRLDLARDLHDFVAHDVSAIVAQAQAGQLTALRDPERAVAMFARIEQAGLRSLASMDQAVDALHPNARAGLSPLPGLRELPELAARYSAAGPARVRLQVAEGIEVPREAATVAYRVVVEALTNVRRHAGRATTVGVDLRPGPRGELEVTVTDDGGGKGGAHPAGRTRGWGLSGLADRVRGLGGTLTYGPYEEGWRVRAVLPPAGSGTVRR
ncbi:histidine kinase [Nonomuraea sp. NPDC050404]|uniref:sensor histidine kinase n=1 Tax=Nonomuraea sp. NPDC050404 TaxID=3155783 RepID=UPI0033C5BBD3